MAPRDLAHRPQVGDRGHGHPRQRQRVEAPRQQYAGQNRGRHGLAMGERRRGKTERARDCQERGPQRNPVSSHRPPLCRRVRTGVSDGTDRAGAASKAP